MGTVLSHPRFNRLQPVIEVWVSKQQLAHHLAVSTRTVDRWARDGLPYSHTGTRRRYKISAVEVWLSRTDGVVADPLVERVGNL